MAPPLEQRAGPWTAGGALHHDLPARPRDQLRQQARQRVARFCPTFILEQIPDGSVHLDACHSPVLLRYVFMKCSTRLFIRSPVSRPLRRSKTSRGSRTLSRPNLVAGLSFSCRNFISEERRVGKECVMTCLSRGSPYH